MLKSFLVAWFVNRDKEEDVIKKHFISRLLITDYRSWDLYSECFRLSIN